jgi:hypothetical protein
MLTRSFADKLRCLVNFEFKPAAKQLVIGQNNPRSPHLAVLLAATLLAACSTLGSYPDDWHDASDAIHIYVSDSAKAIEIRTAGEVVTLLDAVLKVSEPGPNFSHVVVSRPIGSEMTLQVINARNILLTGKSADNIQLQPGNMVSIAG